jgi:hypothetical protein
MLARHLCHVFKYGEQCEKYWKNFYWTSKPQKRQERSTTIS